jgi:hypothetical protein
VIPPVEPTYEVVWPLGHKIPEMTALPARLPDLSGKVVAELWDWLYEGDRAFPIIRTELEARYPGISFVGYETFGNIMQGPAVTRRLPELFREHGVDAVITGVGHCGSCTPAVIRASIAAEVAGIPSVSVVGSMFEGLARNVARFLGVDEMPLAVYPGRIPVDDDDTFREKVGTVVVDEVVQALTASSPVLTSRDPEPAPRDIVLAGSYDTVNDEFYDRMWSDGLPIVPPTVERVDAFMEFTERSPPEVLGVLLQERREATVWNVAVNGVMAGCRPEYFPVLLAIVEAIADPEFRLEDAGGGTGWETLVVVSGPVVKQLDFNAGAGVMRVGRRANTTIGRFLRLYMRNIAGFRIPPSDTDKTGIGSSFNVAMAEDEDTIASVGWPTFGEDRGVRRGQSCVTVQSVAAESPVFGEYGCSPDDPTTYLDPIVEVFGKGICGYWLFTGLLFGRWHPILMISPHFARVLHENGWTKDDVRRYLYEKSRVPASSVQVQGDYVNLDVAAQVAKGLIPAVYHESDDPDRLIPTFLRPEWIQIIVAGNPDMYYQRGYMNYQAHGAPVTRLVEGRA